MPTASPSRVERLARLLTGLLCYGIGISLMVRAGIGVAPWDVLTQGISLQSGLSFGLVTNLIGIGVLVLWLPLRQTPGLGTLLNVLLIGPSAQLGLWLLPDVHGVVLQVSVFAVGLVLLALATGLYIGAQFGAGPRDGLMTGLHARTGVPIWIARTLVEALVLTTGWWLGGNVGWGTLAFALLIGPLCGRTLPLFAPRGVAPPAAPL